MHPTFMRIEKIVDGILYFVDRRACPATDFHNFYYEAYSIPDRGEEYHVEGLLALHSGKCQDFDGSFDLPSVVKEILLEMGYICPWDEFE